MKRINVVGSKSNFPLQNSSQLENPQALAHTSNEAKLSRALQSAVKRYQNGNFPIERSQMYHCSPAIETARLIMRKEKKRGKSKDSIGHFFVSVYGQWIIMKARFSSPPPMNANGIQGHYDIFLIFSSAVSCSQIFIKWERERKR